jgi:phosphatidylglycerophosphatase A
VTRRGAAGGAASAALAVATLFGAGRSPVAPGTAGTLAALPLAWAAGRWLPAWGFAAAAVALTAVAVWSAGVAARRLGRHDPGAVVIDEAAGLFVTFAFLDIGGFTLLTGFLLFRVMDVVKPPPARWCERLPGGWGIVTDDLVAGLYANLGVRIAGSLYVRFL